ncbi:MAG: CRTAC1 family protein [Acidobacteriota bacterium]
MGSLLGLGGAPTSLAEQTAPWLPDVAAEVGLRVDHANGADGRLRFPEMMSTGAALFDADGDGDLDVFLTQGDGPDRLFLNRLERGSLRFEEAPRAGFASLGDGAAGEAMGVAAGDLDGDGDVDLFVANLETDHLWRNRGDGTFDEVGARSGVAHDGWSIGATVFDADRDGALDLFVIDYVVYDASIECYDDSSRRNYCGPDAYPPAPNRLLRGRGDGTFEDTSAAAGLATPPGPSLGVVAEDLDDDGRLDLYVANDGRANRLWLAGDDGTFRDEALLAGAAVNLAGAAEAGMGIAVGDVDANGTFDLLVTHLDGETHTLYAGAGGGLFEDRTVAWGLAAASMPWTSFGTGFFDLENDGDLDLFVASGAVKLPTRLADGAAPSLGQPNQLYRNDGRRFAEVSERAGASFAQRETSRAAAFGDVDNDGDVDILLANNGGPIRLLRNDAANGSRWIGLRVVEPAPRGGDGAVRDALGARVEVALDQAGTRTVLRRVATDGSYAAASDPRVLVGLGDRAGSTSGAIRVRWPDGSWERFPPAPAGRYTTLRRGAGSAATDGSEAPEADAEPRGEAQSQRGDGEQR